MPVADSTGFAEIETKKVLQAIDKLGAVCLYFEAKIRRWARWHKHIVSNAGPSGRSRTQSRSN
jgi:hypothetical protein